MYKYILHEYVLVHPRLKIHMNIGNSCKTLNMPNTGLGTLHTNTSIFTILLCCILLVGELCRLFTFYSRRLFTQSVSCIVYVVLTG